MKITIGGTEVAIRSGTLEMEDSIDERSTLSFVVLDEDGDQEYSKGQPVYLIDELRAIFGGVVENVYTTVKQPSGYKLHEIECIDWHYLADKRVVAEAYEDTQPGVIVKAIVDDYLADEGVQYINASETATFLQPEFVSLVSVDSSIDTFDALKEVVFNYIPASRALDALREVTGAWWRIEPNRNLYFVEREHFEYPDTLTGSDMLHGSVSVEEGNPKYRNRQWVRGGRDVTDEQVEIKPGDGESHDFAVGFRVAQAPKVEVNLDSGGYQEESVLIKSLEERRTGTCNTDGTTVTRTDGSQFTSIMEGKVINIDGTRYIVSSVTDSDTLELTTTAGTQSDAEFFFPVWYWEKLSETITKDRNETALTASDRVKITYRGAIDIIILTQDLEEINERKAIEEVGTGYVEHVYDQSNINSRDAAFEIANKKILKYAQAGKKLNFTTRRNDITPGHLITVNLPEYGFTAEQLLVETVRAYNPPNTNLMFYDVRAVKGPTEESWQKFFSDLSDRAGLNIIRENIGEDQVLVLLWEYTKTNWNAETQPGNILQTLYPEDEATPGDIYPMFDYDDRITHAEFVVDGSVALRKQMTTRSGMDTTEISTSVYLNPLEAQGTLQRIDWYGGVEATDTIGSGIKVVEETNTNMPYEKTGVASIDIQRTDGWS